MMLTAPTPVLPVARNPFSIEPPASPRDPLEFAKEPAEEYGNPVERYELQHILRQSLFGKVVIALDKKTRQQVAIKLSNVQLAKRGLTISGSVVIENPLNEARIKRQLSLRKHPNVLPLADEHVNGNIHWLVMPYMPNGEFFDILSLSGHLTEDISRFYFREMVSALQHLHSHNICHLDFSLENILVDAEWNIKICDFGVAREVSPAERYIEFPKHKKPGKLRYMCPEALHDQKVDAFGMDIFALGVCLFGILTGVSPFEMASTRLDPRYALINAGKVKDLLPLLKVNHLVPVEAADLLQNLLCAQERRLTLEQILAHPWMLKSD